MMHSLDEQMRTIQSRSCRIRQEKRRRRTLLRETGMVCACLILIVGAGRRISGLNSMALPVTASSYGSLIAGNSCIGYIVIGVLAFLLGISVTLLGLHMRKKQDGEGDGEER